MAGRPATTWFGEAWGIPHLGALPSDPRADSPKGVACAGPTPEDAQSGTEETDQGPKAPTQYSLWDWSQVPRKERKSPRHRF